MEAYKILTADLLDIVFENRNKDYGAYQLRKTYSRRLVIALCLMVFLLTMLFIGSMFAKDALPDENARITVAGDTRLKEVDLEKPKLPIPPPPPPPPPTPEVRTVQHTNPPQILKDDDVKPEDMPPLQEDMENARIGVINQDGVDFDNIVAPPVAMGNSVIEAPVRSDNESDDFVPVEVEAMYPGGAIAWQRYLMKTLRYPQEAEMNFIQGAVVVQFIVDKEGMVSDVEAISGPQELREEAVRVIKKSGKWTPAVQNGRHVKSYKKQPIVFRLEN